jgi:hypothetical protein
MDEEFGEDGAKLHRFAGNSSHGGCKGFSMLRLHDCTTARTARLSAGQNDCSTKNIYCSAPRCHTSDSRQCRICSLSSRGTAQIRRLQ